jgi:hypothetical protein
MQFMPDTWAAFGKGDPRDPVASIDAGAAYMKSLIDQYGGDVRAAIAHYNGGGKAGAAVRAGKEAPAAETRNYLQRVDDYMAQRAGTEAGKAMAGDPEAVAAARVALIRQTVDSWNLADPAAAAGAEQHLTAILRASDQLGAGDMVNVTRDISLDDLAHTRMLDDLVSRLERTRADLLPDVGNVMEPGAVRQVRDEINTLQQQRASITDEAIKARAKEVQQADGVSYKQALAAAKKEMDTRLQDTEARITALENQLDTNRSAEQARQQLAALDTQIEGVKQRRAGTEAPTPKAGALAVKQALSSEPAAPRNVLERQPAPAKAAEPSGPAAKTTDAGGNQAGAMLDAQAAEIARLSPDMMVQLEGMEKPMRLADALESVKAEAAQDAADAPLLEVAANCFLRAA